MIRLQVELTVLAALVAAGMAPDAMHAGLSALLGGAIVVMGALVYIGVAFARKRAGCDGRAVLSLPPAPAGLETKVVP